MRSRDSMYEFYTFSFSACLITILFNEKQRQIHRFFLELRLCNIDLTILLPESTSGLEGK